MLPIVPKFTVSTENAPSPTPLHPSMPEVASLFASGRLAVLANAGPLVVPLTRADYTSNSKPRPQALGSHNDQQSTWQALGPEGVKIGWGGHLGDMVASSNGNAVFTSISVAGNAVFSAGQTTFQYQVGNNGAAAIGGITGTLFGSSTASTTLRAIITANNQHLFARGVLVDRQPLDHRAGGVPDRVRRLDGRRRRRNTSSRRPATTPTTASRCSCRRSLASSARAARSAPSGRSSSSSMGGFDTHDTPERGQADLLARLSHAMATSTPCSPASAASTCATT